MLSSVIYASTKVIVREHVSKQSNAGSCARPFFNTSEHAGMDAQFDGLTHAIDGPYVSQRVCACQEKRCAIIKKDVHLWQWLQKMHLANCTCVHVRTRATKQCADRNFTRAGFHCVFITYGHCYRKTRHHARTSWYVAYACVVPHVFAACTNTHQHRHWHYSITVISHAQWIQLVLGHVNVTHGVGLIWLCKFVCTCAVASTLQRMPNETRLYIWKKSTPLHLVNEDLMFIWMSARFPLYTFWSNRIMPILEKKHCFDLL